MRRQKQRTLPSKCVPHGCPARAERHRGTGAAPRIGKTPPAGLPVPMEREFHRPPLIVQVLMWRSSDAYFTSKDCHSGCSSHCGCGSHSGPARHRRSQMAWWRLAWWLARPRRLGLGRVRLGLRAWFRGRLRCALLRRLLWRPVLCLWGRLRHAPPLGDQPLGSSRLAMDSRLLLDVPFGNLRPASRAEASRFAC